MNMSSRYLRSLALLGCGWLVVLVWWSSPASHAVQGQDLRIFILDRADGGLVFAAGHDAGATKVEIDADTAARLAAVRFTVECAVDNECNDQKIDPVEGQRAVLSGEALEQFLTEAGRKILTPFASQLRSASRLRVHIPMHLVKIAIDALEFEGQPLFVRLPIVYIIGGDITPASLTLGATSVGLLISDKTADPDRAVFNVANLFPKSVVLDAEEVDEAKVSSYAQVDFALVSAHGRAGYQDSDVISLSDKNILEPDAISRLRPQIVYFDSCNLGISLRYLGEMQTAGIKYVLAPIISNEAGNSSTLTMNSFFREIIGGRDPVDSLHVARVRAYEAYGHLRAVSQLANALRSMNVFFREIVAGNDPVTALHAARMRVYEVKRRHQKMTQLWRAFPFRIYALN